MLEQYPDSGRKNIDEEADNQIAILKEMVTASRILRSRMRVSPSERVPLIVSGEKAPSEHVCELIRVLGKFSECRVVQDEEFPKDTSTELAAGYRLTLEIQIDKEAELRLLNDQITKARENLERESAKLKNQGFVAKAPREVVEEVRKRIVDLEKNVEELNQSIGTLASS